MKQFLIFLTITLTCLALFSATAEAKRFGGGSSFGKQRTMAPQQARPAASPTAAPAPSGNRWMGPLAGLAIGAGLGALFFGHGAMGNILMVLLAFIAAMFVISLFRKRQPAMQYAGAPSQPPQYAQQQYAGGSGASSAGRIPADFPTESFLRSAKASFIRLQAANDKKDLDDIREYTTPEMFAEVSMQMQERGSDAQRTVVLALNADLLEVVHEGDYAIASVRFIAQLRENNGSPERVDEIWHVQKNLKDDHSAWLLAGIQQTVLS